MSIPLKEKRTPLQEAFGSKLKQRRLAKKISQEKLAEYADLEMSYIGSVERGERDLSLSRIAMIAKGLGCSMKELMPE
jgi:transcriptional regulator with XRE-family HTH domain